MKSNWNVTITCDMLVCKNNIVRKIKCHIDLEQNKMKINCQKPIKFFIFLPIKSNNAHLWNSHCELPMLFILNQMLKFVKAVSFA